MNVLRIGMYVVLCTVFALPLGGVSAQTISLSDTTNVTLTPEYPGAFSETTVSVESFNTDLRRAEITWRVDGEVRTRAVGQTEFSFTTGALGERITISMEALTLDGKRVSESITISPSIVTLIAEGAGYVPPFYQGATRYLYDGRVRVSAIPELYQNGRLVPPENLVYTWEVRHTRSPELSGFGAQTITLGSDTTYRASVPVAVTVTTLDGEVAGRGSLVLQPANGIVRLYQRDLLLGTLFSTALERELSLTGNEVTLEAYPYFFDVAERDARTLTYDWRMNGARITTGDTPSAITLRQTGESGRARINLLVTDSQSFLARAARALYITFGDEQSRFSF